MEAFMRMKLWGVIMILLLAGCTDYRAHKAYEPIPDSIGSESKIDDDFLSCYREATNKAWKVNDTADHLLGIAGGGLIGGAIGGAAAGGIMGASGTDSD